MKTAPGGALHATPSADRLNECSTAIEDTPNIFVRVDDTATPTLDCSS